MRFGCQPGKGNELVLDNGIKQYVFMLCLYFLIKARADAAVIYIFSDVPLAVPGIIQSVIWKRPDSNLMISEVIHYVPAFDVRVAFPIWVTWGEEESELGRVNQCSVAQQPVFLQEALAVAINGALLYSGMAAGHLSTKAVPHHTTSKLDVV